MKNKKLIAIGVLIIGALAFAGCSSDSSDSKSSAKSPSPTVAPVAEPVQAPVANADQNKSNSIAKNDTKEVATNNKKDVTANNSKEVMSNNTTTETNKVVSNKTEVKVNPTTKAEVKNTSNSEVSQNVDTTKNTNESKQSTTTNENTNNFGGINPNFVEHPEMNRTHTVTLGQYATTTYNAAATTDADIINFYNAKIKGTNNAYFTLINGNNSIQFVNCDSQMMMKGPISIPSQHIIGNPTYYGEISGDKIIWRKASN